MSDLDLIYAHDVQGKKNDDAAKKKIALAEEAFIHGPKIAEYNKKRDNLIAYLLDRVNDGDWHGVADSACDLRVMEARKP